MKKYKVKPRFFVITTCILASALFLGFNYSRFWEDEKTFFAQGVQNKKIVMTARAYISNPNLRYEDNYYDGGYPPEDIGVCTDVVWKGFQGIGVNLKELVDNDIEQNFQAYEDVISVHDANIDFRLVPVLEVFFQRQTEVLTNDPYDLLAWQPGDIVVFESSHIAIVSNLTNIWGRPYIIQHGKDPAAEEDRLVAADGMEISGHFRWPLIQQ